MLHLRSKGGAANRRLGQGQGYLYAHDFPENISGQPHLQHPLRLYTPKAAGWETRVAERLARWQELRTQRANDVI